MQGVHLRKYGVQTTIDFEVYEVDGVDLRVDWVPAASDCEVMKDEGASTQCTNTATDEGSTYSIVLTATEMQFARGVLKIVDAATKVFLDKVIVIETYGHASAMHAMDFDDAVRGGMTALPNAVADGAGGLPISDAGGLDLDTKLANTNEVTAARMGALTDWINGGRLDNLLDAIPTAVEIQAEMEENGASFLDTIRDELANATDGLSALKALIDAAQSDVTLIKAITDWQRSVSGTVVVNNPGTDTIFDLTAVIGTLSANNDAYNNMVITFFDASGGVYETRKVSAFVGASGRVTIDTALTFPVQDGVDTFILWNKYSPTAAAGGGATAQEVHEYDVSEIVTEGQAGYEIQQRGGRNSIYT